MIWTALLDILPYLLVFSVAYTLGVATGLSQAPDPTDEPSSMDPDYRGRPAYRAPHPDQSRW